MKIEITQFALISSARENTPVVFVLDDYGEVDRRMLWALFSPTLNGRGLKIEDFAMLLTLDLLTQEQRKIIVDLKILMEVFDIGRALTYRVTCEWKSL